MEMKKFVSIRELCQATGLSQHFVRQLVKSGQLPYLKSGCKVLINWDLASSLLDGMCE